VIASAWLLLGGVIQPNAFGYAFIIAQAVAVALFAELQLVALRKNIGVGTLGSES
jgi:hypothetical protein